MGRCTRGRGYFVHQAVRPGVWVTQGTGGRVRDQLSDGASQAGPPHRKGQAARSPGRHESIRTSAPAAARRGQNRPPYAEAFVGCAPGRTRARAERKRKESAMNRSRYAMLTLACGLLLPLPAWGEEVVRSIRWQELAAANKLNSGVVIPSGQGADGPSLRVIHKDKTP